MTDATDATNGTIEEEVEQATANEEAQPQAEAVEEKEPEEAPAGETTEDEDLSDKLSKLQESLRAVAAERNRLKQELARFRESAVRQETVEDRPGEPAQARQQYRHPDDTYRDAGRFVDPRLAGMPYDPVDGTVYIGDPSDLDDGGAGKVSKWVEPDDAIALIEARRLSEEMARIEREKQASQIQEVVQTISDQYEKALVDMREKALPGLSGEAAEIVDDLIRGYTSHKLGLEGYTIDHFASLDEKALLRGAEAIKESVESVKKLLVLMSRSVNEKMQHAVQTTPVDTGSNVAVPEGKPVSEMTPSEHRAYILSQLLNR